jgi:hypothetical protein
LLFFAPSASSPPSPLPPPLNAKTKKTHHVAHGRRRLVGRPPRLQLLLHVGGAGGALELRLRSHLSGGTVQKRRERERGERRGSILSKKTEVARVAFQSRSFVCVCAFLRVWREAAAAAVVARRVVSASAAPPSTPPTLPGARPPPPRHPSRFFFFPFFLCARILHYSTRVPTACLSPRDTPSRGSRKPQGATLSLSLFFLPPPPARGARPERVRAGARALIRRPLAGPECRAARALRERA